LTTLISGKIPFMPILSQLYSRRKLGDFLGKGGPERPGFRIWSLGTRNHWLFEPCSTPLYLFHHQRRGIYLIYI
jgi:hypothetical protein